MTDPSEREKFAAEWLDEYPGDDPWTESIDGPLALLWCTFAAATFGREVMLDKITDHLCAAPQAERERAFFEAAKAYIEFHRLRDPKFAYGSAFVCRYDAMQEAADAE